MVIPASQGTAIFEHGSRGRIRTADHRVKACYRNRLATRLCVAVSSGWSRLCLPCRIWQTHRRYSALSTRGIFMRVHHYLDTGTSANPSLETTTLHFSIWRTGWDSNPRMLSHRRFSRPLPSSSRQPVLWWECRDLNPKPADYESDALPIELHSLLVYVLLLFLNLTSLTGLFRAFRAASCSAHRIATAFMPPKLASFSRGILATFRLVCRACLPSPFVVKTVSRFRDNMSIENFENKIM